MYCPCTDGKIPISNITRWDGSQWLPLGSGVNGKVERIIVDSITNELYVFGDFTNAGGIPVKGQAKWSEKKQAWSTILPSPEAYISLYTPVELAVSNGNIYYCKPTTDKLYNSDSTFFDKQGLYVFDGAQWKLLDKLFDQDQNYYIIPDEIRIYGTILYISGRVGNDSQPFHYNLYLYDLVSKKIIDSIPYSTIVAQRDIIIYDNVSVSDGGIFIDEGNGFFWYNNGIRKKIIQNETNDQYPYSLVSSSSEYSSLWNYVSIFSPETSQRYITIYDIKGDSTYKQTVHLDTRFIQQYVNTTYISGHTMFVGGAFYFNENGADVRNIASYDLRQKKWYDMAGGVCGPVHAFASIYH
ncbi:MAG: hypothetical protein HYZ54_05365 [Ignavibacteriae bacterium]|nr:hypothetical protein [Ignavibacteriota bacterium]